MIQNLTVWGAVGQFFKNIGSRIRTKKWWKTVLWILWLIFSLAFLSAVLGSIGEYEPRAAWLYGLILLILLAIGVWAAFRGSRAPQVQQD